MKIVLIGSGNLATQLAPALKKSGNQIVCVYSRKIKNASALANKIKTKATNKISELPIDADLYIVAIQDDAIQLVLDQLEFNPKLIVHTSGSVPLTVLSSKYKNSGVLYPLQTFTLTGKTNWKKTPILIEGSNKNSLGILEKLANAIASKVVKVNSDKRSSIHLAAVFANNFVNYMFTIASDILKNEKISFDLLKPIILETTSRIINGDPLKSQTGPAKRKDHKTISKHLKMLKADTDKKKVYQSITTSILNKYSK